jgi:polyphosphate kinase
MLENEAIPVQVINREISLLEFQRRVLKEVQEEINPLLERVKFLSIFYSNLDEFFMVRVSGILRQVNAHVVDVFPDGLNPAQVLEAVQALSIELYALAAQAYDRKVRPLLEKSGIHLLDYRTMSSSQVQELFEYFKGSVLPLLTPLAYDPGHPFPHINGMSINLAIVVNDENGQNRFAFLWIPDTLPRLVPVHEKNENSHPDASSGPHYYFAWLEQVIVANLASLFPNVQVIGAYPFRVLRDADLAVQQVEADDLLQAMQRRVYRSKFASVVQLSVYETMPLEIRNFLCKQFSINKQRDLYVSSAPLGMGDLHALYGAVGRPDLKFPPYQPYVPLVFRGPLDGEAIFQAIREKNILIHRPYDSFTPILDFLFASARDPRVATIKQTIYRLDDHAVVIEALIEASQRGKDVTALVELQARFDEESNITWAQKLESAGVHVVYGMDGLKTHCKVILVVRQEQDGIRRYIHLSTGNYNAVTSQFYEDIGYFTSDPALGQDATDLFNYLTGYSRKQDFKKIFAAPMNLRQKQEELIKREIAHARKGLPARLIFKANSMVDLELIKLLYEASQAGVKVDLIVRGICCLLPGVKGLSENIRVISIVGRFLEHSRIYYFHNNGSEEIYLSSADMMPRNLDYRVEAMFPVTDSDNLQYIRRDVLEKYLQDDLHAHIMQPDGSYECPRPSRAHPFSVQDWLMTLAQRSDR